MLQQDRLLKMLYKTNIPSCKLLMPLWENSGTTAYDICVGNGTKKSGTYSATGLTLAKTGVISQVPLMCGFSTGGKITGDITASYRGLYKETLIFALNVVNTGAKQQIYYESVEDNAEVTRLGIYLDETRHLVLDARSTNSAGTLTTVTSTNPVPVGFNLIFIRIVNSGTKEVTFYKFPITSDQPASGLFASTGTLNFANVTFNDVAPAIAPTYGQYIASDLRQYMGDMGMVAHFYGLFSPAVILLYAKAGGVA